MAVEEGSHAVEASPVPTETQQHQQLDQVTYNVIMALSAGMYAFSQALELYANTRNTDTM
jgi:hypothetical protein